MNISKRIDEVDGLRGFAVLSVLFWHLLHNPVSQSKTLPEGLKSVLTGPPFSLGWTGVDLFFVISGFLIGRILLQMKEGGNSLTIGGYFIRRACRILPLYYLLIMGYLAITALPIDVNEGLQLWALGDSDIPLHYFFTMNSNVWMASNNTFGPAWFGVTWSLGVEVHFYILSALFLVLTPRRYVPILCIFVILASITCRLYVTENFNNISGLIFTPARLDTLFMGVLVASLASRNYFKSQSARFWIGLKIALLAAVGWIIYSNVQDPRVFSPWMQSVGYTLIGVAYTTLFILVCFHKSQTWYKSIFLSRPLRKLGDISYGVYLFHFPIHFFLLHISWRQGFAVDTPIDFSINILTVLLTFVFSYVLHQSVENPMIALGKKLTAPKLK